MSSHYISADATGEFPVDVPEYFFYLMFVANRRRELTFDLALAPLGLSLNRWRSLSVIRRLSNCTMKDLARYTTIDRTTLTRSIDHLVAEGLVTRETPAGDRRKVEISLTDLGEQTYIEAVKVLQRFNRDAMAGLSADTQRLIVRSLKTLVENLVDDPGLRAELIAFNRVAPGAAA